jgi:hypothetical protein
MLQETFGKILILRICLNTETIEQYGISFKIMLSHFIFKLGIIFYKHAIK